MDNVADSGSLIIRPNGTARKRATRSADEKSMKVRSLMSIEEFGKYALYLSDNFLLPSTETTLPFNPDRCELFNYTREILRKLNIGFQECKQKLKPLDKCGLVRSVISCVLVECEGFRSFRAREEHHLIAICVLGDLSGVIETGMGKASFAVILMSDHVLDEGIGSDVP